MDKIQIVNVLLTRRCNLKCEYCSIVRNYSDKPEQYPDISYYHKNEISFDKWIEIIERIKSNNKNVFFIFYGGEPFLYKGLENILRHCNIQNINYTVITNNTDYVQPEIFRIYKSLGPYSGFTSSVDPIILKNDDGSHIWKKSFLGFERLSKILKDGIAKDVVAEVTITKDTIKDAYNLIKRLSENGIYSSITCIDDKKSCYYDFSTVEDKNLLIQKDQIIYDEFQKIINDKTLLIHIPELLMELYKILPSNMKCDIYKDVHNLCLDSDRTIRLCLRIRGIETPKLKLDQIIDKDGKIQKQFKNSLKHDYNKYCKSCNHTCLLMSKMFSNSILNH